MDDSPAELAAIEPGSIIFGVDTNVTRDISQFVNYIEGGKSPGDNIGLDVLTNNGARSAAAAVAFGEKQ